jgi:cytochrome c-type biogenesis protein CcmH
MRGRALNPEPVPVERSRGTHSSAAEKRASTSLGGVPRLRSGRTVLGMGILLFLAAPALADSPLPPAALADTQLPDPAQERRARALMEEVRCLVCQGQSIADSDAEMAGDMRALIRDRIRRGESPESIRAWLIERYGNWVSYNPPLEPVTWPLWALPALLLLAGLWLARGRFKRRAP